LDKSDNDLARFYYNLRIAAREARSHDKSSHLHLFPVPRRKITKFAKRYFERLYQNFAAPFLIVLDNYQEIAGDAAVHEAIEVACAELPPGGRIVIITNETLPPAIAQLRARNLAAILEPQDLAENV
jgi:ATP/maltotriose-dependent transcriptional regulator MalT